MARDDNALSLVVRWGAEMVLDWTQVSESGIAVVISRNPELNVQLMGTVPTELELRNMSENWTIVWWDYQSCPMSKGFCSKDFEVTWKCFMQIGRIMHSVLKQVNVHNKIKIFLYADFQEQVGESQKNTGELGIRLGIKSRTDKLKSVMKRLKAKLMAAKLRIPRQQIFGFQDSAVKMIHASSTLKHRVSDVMRWDILEHPRTGPTMHFIISDADFEDVVRKLTEAGNQVMVAANLDLSQFLQMGFKYSGRFVWKWANLKMPQAHPH